MAIQVEKIEKLVYNGNYYNSVLDVKKAVEIGLRDLLLRNVGNCYSHLTSKIIEDSEFREKLVQLLTVEYEEETVKTTYSINVLDT